MALQDETFETLRTGSETGLEFDGLRLDRDDDGYVLETPLESRTGLSATELRTALEAVDEYVTNWRYWQETVGSEGEASRAFLRWCEQASVAGSTAGGSQETEPLSVPARYEALRDGIDRTWGQLRITTRFLDVDDPNGVRVYDLWHVDDADTPLSSLEVYDEPRQAREIATADDDGRYRPLKTAPTLASGWAFTGLSGTELVDAVEFFYPATVANWHREREGELDIDHWVDTAERQSGIYDIVDELPREALEWMTEACCVDSQCLRRREWEYSADEDIDVDGGDGIFPCREPCSLVIAAARKWAILESETEKTYQLELTTSELNQLEELIDAVADGRVEGIREADVNEGANRYRARYLRAKRFEDGSLNASTSDGDD